MCVTAVKNAPQKQPEQHDHVAHGILKLVDHDVDADMDTGAHAIGGAELGRPTRHVDATVPAPRTG